ncbi:MAG: Glucosamine ABC transport system, periplasmic sugar-binding protein [Anaerolineae bacterium]|nr:MAG: Glucosamine ABC transport system, periplasmic sugar-binding protein [Anaerolineae bacterium]
MKTKVLFFITFIVVLSLAMAACAPTTEATPAVPAETEPPQAPTQETIEQPTEPAPQPTQAESVTIRMLVRPDEGGNVAKYAAQFEQETGIKVAVDFVAWNEITNKTLTTLASGGGGYDIVFMPSADAPKLAAGGWFEPINDLMPESEKPNWLPTVVDFYTFDGQLLAMPWYAGGAHMSYNKEILEKAGVDPAGIVTWDDFMAACKKIKESAAAEFCFTPSAKFPGNFYYNWGTMVLSRGGEFFDENGAPIFQNSTAALDAFQFLKDGVDNGYFNPAGVAMDDYETLIVFGSGNTAFLLDSTWASTQANRNPDLSTITGKVGYILVPGAGEVRSAAYLYAGGLGVLKTSTHKEEAKQFIVYLTSAEAQKHHAIEGANMPTRIALYEDAEIAAAWPGFTELAAQLNYGRFVPTVPWFDEWRRLAASAVQEVMSGTKTPQEAVDWLVAETERLRSQ